MGGGPGRRPDASAEIYWLNDGAADGRPHVTPLIAVWSDGALPFCTGPDEQKARNLGPRKFALTTGSNSMGEGLDVVVEGDAVRVTDHAMLERIADAFEAKYGTTGTSTSATARSRPRR